MTHIVGIDLSKGQLSKLRNGHVVRVKKGTGFNLIVNPGNYNIVSRAFSVNKRAQISLSSEEMNMNKNISPEQAAELDSSLSSIEGTGIYAGKGLGKIINKELKKFYKFTKENPVTRALIKTIGPELASKGAEAAYSYYNPDDKQGAKMAGKIGKIAGKESVKQAGYGLYAGSGLYAGGGFLDLKRATEGVHKLGESTAGLSEKFVHALTHQPPIKSYWNDVNGPISRGTGINRNLHDLNLIRGKGSMLEQSFTLPPALQSQPDGANYSFKNMLPPQYQKYHSI